MPRPPRADEAGELYHVLNHGESHGDIFHEESDFDAFELVLHEALQWFHVELFSYQLMSNHFHLVLRPQVDGEMGRFVGWVCGTHTIRYRADYGTNSLRPTSPENPWRYNARCFDLHKAQSHRIAHRSSAAN